MVKAYGFVILISSLEMITQEIADLTVELSAGFLKVVFEVVGVILHIAAKTEKEFLKGTVLLAPLVVRVGRMVRLHSGGLW
jgi:hypothetical protein